MISVFSDRLETLFKRFKPSKIMAHIASIVLILKRFIFDLKKKNFKIQSYKLF